MRNIPLPFVRASTRYDNFCTFILPFAAAALFLYLPLNYALAAFAYAVTAAFLMGHDRIVAYLDEINRNIATGSEEDES